MIGWLRSLLFHLAYLAVTLVMGVAALPLLLGPPAWSRRLGSYWSAVVLWLSRWIAGLGYRIEGELPPGPIIIAAKHQSAFETYLFPAIRHDAVFVLKRELLRAPLVGWYLARSGQIAIDRSASMSAMRAMLTSAAGRVDQGLSVVIFPEGTRVPYGRPAEIKPGVSALYTHLGLPVVPVALDSGRYWPRLSFLRQPGEIVVKIGAPIPPGLKRKPFEAALAAAIDGAPLPTPEDR